MVLYMLTQFSKELHNAIYNNTSMKNENEDKSNETFAQKVFFDELQQKIILQLNKYTAHKKLVDEY